MVPLGLLLRVVFFSPSAASLPSSFGWCCFSSSFFGWCCFAPLFCWVVLPSLPFVGLWCFPSPCLLWADAFLFFWESAPPKRGGGRKHDQKNEKAKPLHQQGCSLLLLLVELPPFAFFRWRDHSPFQNEMEDIKMNSLPPLRVRLVRPSFSLVIASSTFSSFSGGSHPPSSFGGVLPSLPFGGGRHYTPTGGRLPLPLLREGVRHLLPSRLGVNSPPTFGGSSSPSRSGIAPAFGWGDGQVLGVLGLVLGFTWLGGSVSCGGKLGRVSVGCLWLGGEYRSVKSVQSCCKFHY